MYICSPVTILNDKLTHKSQILLLALLQNVVQGSKLGNMYKVDLHLCPEHI